MSIEAGSRVLRHEAEALLALSARLDQAFVTAVDWIIDCRGRVVACGVGKSGHIARKAAGTLSSTGTPSLFLHAAEAVHGDLGAVAPGDIVLLYSHSGETDEIVRLFPSLREGGAKTVLITGRPDSSAGRLADHVLDTGVSAEACPNDLAPTTSTTVMLALSDALAVAAMERRRFSRQDFARFHPSGTLGKRLLLRVPHVMRPLKEMAVVRPEDDVLEVMHAITQARVGAACVVDDERRLLGLVSDGDLRRHLEVPPHRMDACAAELMTADVATLDPHMLAVEALEAFQNHPRKAGDMPVLEDGKVLGLVTLKDLLRSGIV